MAIPVKLEVFEGPLDLLLHLIDRNKIDIYDIPIAMITEQYLEYVAGMEQRNMDVISEFLVMGATLLNIKSRMLLPCDKEEGEEQEDPRQELVDRLLEYKKYKYMSYELKDLQVDASRILFKSPTIPDEVMQYRPEVDMDELIGDLTLSRLHSIFQMVIRKQADKIDPIRSRFKKVEKEPVTIPQKMDEVREYARKHGKFGFRALLEEQCSKMEVIVTFLSILELMKEGTLQVVQVSLFADIEMEFTGEHAPNAEEDINGVKEVRGGN